MRVIAGAWRGRRLVAPPGDHTRPTADRVREAVFSMLGPLDNELRVLDLFAGSGAMGIEALSRGAAAARFCDEDRAAVAAIQANLKALDAGPDVATVVRSGAQRLLQEAQRASDTYDLIFLDPPYQLAAEFGPALQDDVAAVLAAGGRVVTESGRRRPMTLDRLPMSKERRYGTTLIRIHAHA